MDRLTVVAIKAIDGDEWALDVLGVPYGGPNGGKDSDGEYFSATTNLYLDRYPTVPAVYYHGYDENGLPASDPQIIGKTTGHELRADGVWFRVVLDKANAYAKRVWEAAKQGIARASSGSISHLRRVQPDGHITHWPVAELSIFDAVGRRQPANQYAVALPVMKAVYDRAGITLPDDIEGDEQPEPEAGTEGEQHSAPAAMDGSAHDNNSNSSAPIKGEGINMTEEELKAAVTAQVAEQLAAERAAAKAAADAEAAVQERIKEAAKSLAADMVAAQGSRLPSPVGVPAVAQFGDIAKYDGLDVADLAVLAAMGKASKMAGRTNGPTESLLRAMVVRLGDSAEGNAPEHGAAKATLKAAQMQVHGGAAIKANELNYSTLSSYGDEWIGVTYSNALWNKIRQDTQVVGRIPTITVPQGSESVVIPLESTAPTFYKVAQATAQDANPGRTTATYTTSRQGTASQTLTVAKLGAAVNYTGELEEDSLIPWVQELRRVLTAEAAEVLEHIVIDGDTVTTATTNINDIGGTPGGTESFLLLNGFRKLALVTNTANSRSAGTLAVEDYLETLKLMGLGGRNAIDKAKVSFITDTRTNWASMVLAELKTQDVHAQPTIEGGALTQIWGREVITSANMHRANQDATYGLMANTSGKLDLDTAANNTTGSILAVRWDQWRFGYKRMMNFEVQREPLSDSTLIVVNMRVGLINRDAEASAISYNVTLS
jgi:hypothetical protein